MLKDVTKLYQKQLFSYTITAVPRIPNVLLYITELKFFINSQSTTHVVRLE